MHEEHGTTGRYAEHDGVILVAWDRFNADRFVDVAGVCVHQNLLDKALRLEDVYMFSSGNAQFRASEVTLNIFGSNYEVALRTGTTDIPTFEQIFGRDEFGSPDLPRGAKAIVDLGANIGLSAIHFALCYHSAHILALEPDQGNYTQMLKNVTGMRGRIRPVLAAAWHASGTINMRSESEIGADLGEWGCRVSAEEGGVAVACFSPTDILSLSGFDRVDILKIDIEGAELELFGLPAPDWLDAVDLVIVEPHTIPSGRARTPASVVRSRRLSERLPPRGENLFFRNQHVPTPRSAL